MKRSLLIIALCVCIPIIMFSKIPYSNIAEQYQPAHRLPNINKLSVTGINTDKTNTDNTLGVLVDTFGDANFSQLGMVTPIVYEPISQTISIVCSQILSGTPLNGSLYLKISTDNGVSWVKKSMFTGSGVIPTLPSLAVTNPTASTDPSNLDFTINSVVARNSGGSYPWDGSFVIVPNVAPPDDTLGAHAPVGLSPNIYRWWTTTMSSYAKGKKEVALSTGQLIASTGGKAGNVGVWSWDVQGTTQLNTVGIPATWDVSNFRDLDAGNDPTSYRTTSSLFTDVDKNGTFYAAVNNMFKPNIDVRVPGVSTSTDFGKTWSGWDQMPASTINSYLSLYGANPIGGSTNTSSGSYGFEQFAFVVSDVNQWDIFFRMILIKPDNTYELHIVDCYKKNGAWGMYKVANFYGTPYYIENTDYSGATSRDSVRSQGSFTGSELQAAKTADGNSIILKWVDFDTTKTEVLSTPFRITGGEILDTLLYSQVYLSYRDLINNKWSAKVNASNNMKYNKCSFIPQIVPSKTKVPLTTLVSIKPTSITNARYSYPIQVLNLVMDGVNQQLMFSLADATKDASTAVNDNTLNYNFQINSIVPNPVRENCDITFTLDNDANTTIELYNALGQRVNVLLNSFQSSGIHAVNVNTDNLTAGAYYVRLTCNGNSMTKIMTVVR